MDSKDDGAWFAAKTYGYGSGPPIAWQGWAMVAAHIAVVLGGLPLIRESQTAFTVFALVMVVIPLPLYAAKTRGGWKWRWGKD